MKFDLGIAEVYFFCAGGGGWWLVVGGGDSDGGWGAFNKKDVVLPV